MVFGLAFVDILNKMTLSLNGFVLSFLLLGIGCNYSSEHSKTEKKHSKQAANQHMHKRSFGDLVKTFENRDRIEWQKPQQITESLGNLEGKTIADIGAGTGYFSFRLAEAGAKVLALDVDDRFLKYIKNKKIELGDSLIQTRKVPYDDPQLDSNSVDMVIIVDTYHHIENREKYFAKVLYGLKEGGQLIVIDFKKEETPHGPPLEMRVSGLDVLKELQQAGYSKTIIDVSSLPFQYKVVAKKAVSKKQ